MNRALDPTLFGADHRTHTSRNDGVQQDSEMLAVAIHKSSRMILGCWPGC
jgi:hypothetical protein